MRAATSIVLAFLLILAASSSAATAPTVVGSAYYSGGPRALQGDPQAAPGLAIVVSKGNDVVLREVTGPHGRFALRLARGTYLLKAEIGTPAHVCGAVPVHVQTRRTTQLTLYCNIR